MREATLRRRECKRARRRRKKLLRGWNMLAGQLLRKHTLAGLADLEPVLLTPRTPYEIQVVALANRRFAGLVTCKALLDVLGEYAFVFKVEGKVTLATNGVDAVRWGTPGFQPRYHTHAGIRARGSGRKSMRALQAYKPM